MPVPILLIALLLVPTAALAASDYRLDIQLFPDEQRLAGEAQISWDGSAEQELALQLSKACTILAVQQDGTDLDYRFSGGILRISQRSAAPLVIRYQGRFDDAAPESPAHNEDPGYGVSAVISPQGTYLSGGVDWYPRLPGAEMRYQVSIEAPAGMAAVTSGQRLEQSEENGRSRSAWRIDYPLGGLTLAWGLAYLVGLSAQSTSGLFQSLLLAVAGALGGAGMAFCLRYYGQRQLTGLPVGVALTIAGALLATLQPLAASWIAPLATPESAPLLAARVWGNLAFFGPWQAGMLFLLLCLTAQGASARSK